MSGEGPLAALTVVTAMAAYTVSRVATQLPDPGDPGFPTVLAMVCAFAGGTWKLVRTRSWQGVQLHAFKCGFVATGAGLAIYGFGLVSGLY